MTIFNKPVGIILMIFLCLNCTDGGVDGEGLFEEYFQIHKAPASKNPNPNVIIRPKWVGHYLVKEYEAAKEILLKIPPKATDYEVAQFYLGNIYLHKEEAEKAELAFKNALSKRNGKLKEEGEWYLGLTYLKLEKEEEAKLLLKGISERQDHKFQKEAEQLISSLEN